MKRLPVVVLGGIAAALAGTAIAAAPKSHVMDVPLPDGSVAHVEYVGDVAPKVTVGPAPLSGGLWATGAFPGFGNFDKMIEQMDRQTAAMMRQVQQTERQAVAAPGMNVASFGNMPAGANSVSVVTVSNGGSSCTRTTEVVSQGPGKAPKVTNKAMGNCEGMAQPPAPPVPPTPGKAPAALDRT